MILLRVWAKDLEICKLPSLEGWRAEWEPIDRRIVPVSQEKLLEYESGNGTVSETTYLRK